MKRVCLALCVLLLLTIPVAAKQPVNLGMDEQKLQTYILDWADKDTTSKVPFVVLRVFLSNSNVKDEKIRLLGTLGVPKNKAKDVMSMNQRYEYSMDGKTCALIYRKRP